MPYLHEQLEKMRELAEGPTLGNLHPDARAQAIARAGLADRERMAWLHSAAAVDADGYEWGVFRVKWENGRAVDVQRTRADLADIDSAMLWAAPTEAVQQPAYWQWRRKHEPWSVERTFDYEVFATTADSEVRPLYATPPSSTGHGAAAVGGVPELTDERIRRILGALEPPHGRRWDGPLEHNTAFARAIEREVFALLAAAPSVHSAAPQNEQGSQSGSQGDAGAAPGGEGSDITAGASASDKPQGAEQ